MSAVVVAKITESETTQIKETKMRKFKGKIKTDAQGSDCEFEFEVPDDATPELIEREAREAAFNFIEWHYKEVKIKKPV